METLNLAQEVAAPKRPLLQTKLCMPRERNNVIVRQRLLDQLNTAVSADGTLQPKLTLITGPAGYGKTTLATQWINQFNHPIAWLSLDAGDNDEARFMAYLFAAVGTIQEEIGEASLARLTSTYVYNDSDAILTSFLNDIAVSEQPIILVLDDYHLITDDAVHQVMAFILQHMPVQLHLVVTSRSEPPFPVALLRARNGINQIDAGDLRFTPDEAIQFLSQTMNVTLTREQVIQLDAQVEGWVTGLQLIALALQEEVALQEAFSGSQRYLVDYLADQVLDKQPEAIQQFLLDTAVLPQFNSDLCKAVTGHECHEILREVENANLFLIPLDAARNWYRYHHLFADFLNGRLQRQRSPEQIAEMHTRAARWYQQNGQSLTAVEHALTANDFEFAAELMMEVGREVLMFGEGNTLRQWIETLPPELQSSTRRMRLFYAWALIRTGEFKQAATVLDGVADELDTALLWGEYAALRARIAVITGDTDISVRFSEKALHKLPLDQHMLRSEVAINLGFSHLKKAKVEEAREAFSEAAQNTSHDPGLWSVMFATFYWGQTYERQAQLHEAYEIYQRGLEMAQSRTNGRNPSPAIGFMHVGMGKLLYEWNRLGEAETHLRRAVHFAERCGDHKMMIYSREGLAKLLATLGDWDGAYAIIDDLERDVNAKGPTQRRVALALQQGDTRLGLQWAERLNIGVTDSPEKITEWPSAYLTLTRLHMAVRRYDGLLPILDTLIAWGEGRNSVNFLLEVSLLKAILLGRMGDLDTAVPILQRILTTAESEGYVRLFLDEQDGTLIRLLHRVGGSGVTAVYARNLLSLLDPQEDDQVNGVQPLSPREIEVLQHLAAGQTNRQIAEEMVVSHNTIKAHTRRLYEKLGVNNRTQAVARARELQLL